MVGAEQPRWHNPNKERRWEIVKWEAVDKKAGLQWVVVRNVSGQEVELVRSWNLMGVAKCNIGLAPEKPPGPGEFVLPAAFRKLFSENCHQPANPLFTVGAGETARVAVPVLDFASYPKGRLVLLLTEKGGVVEAGRLFPENG